MHLYPTIHYYLSAYIKLLDYLKLYLGFYFLPSLLYRKNKLLLQKKDLVKSNINISRVNLDCI